MPRVRTGAARTRRHKRVLKSTRGMIGAASRRYRVAREAQVRAGQHATIGRKLKKRDFRRLWITRISAACRQRGHTYSRFIHGLSERGVAVNRKMLADLAVSDPGAFDDLLVAAGLAVAGRAAPAKKAEAKPKPKAEPKAKAEEEIKPEAEEKPEAEAAPEAEGKPEPEPEAEAKPDEEAEESAAKARKPAPVKKKKAARRKKTSGQ